MTFTTPSLLDTETDFTLDDLPDVAATLHELRTQKPAAWGKAFGEPTLFLLTHDLVHAAFRDEDQFPAAAFYGQVVTDVLGRNLQCMAGEEHRVNRALVSPAFRQRLMPDLVEPILEPVAHELIDRFEARGEADLVAEFTSVYPFTIITRLLGLPRHSEEEIRRWAIAMFDLRNYAFAQQCSREFVAFVALILQARRRDPGDDLLSSLATVEVDGHRLTDDEIFSFLRLLFPAGADTTYLGLGSTLFHLLTNEDQLERVRANPIIECRWAAEEGLRLDPPTAWIPRRNPDDILWHDIAIPAGASMMLGVMAANRDPAVHDDPDRFDVARRAASVMTFGFGAHYCLGAHLARIEIDVGLRVLLARLPRIRITQNPGVRITGTIHHLLRGPTGCRFVSTD
jgi:cytochrome P450